MSFLWSRQWLFWPLASAAYVSIGTLVGLILYWRYCRHHYLNHKWKIGERFRSWDGCWCDNNYPYNTAVQVASYSAPILWPLALVVALFVFPVRIIVSLYRRIERIATWDGKTVEDAHPTAIETIDEEIKRRLRASEEVKRREGTSLDF